MNQQNNNSSSSDPADEHREYTKKHFDEKYKRMTIYVQKDLYQEIQYLREQGRITNLTQFFHHAIDNHLHGK